MLPARLVTPIPGSEHLETRNRSEAKLSDHNMRIELRELGSHVGDEVVIEGWVQTVRAHAKVAFVVVRDGTGRVQFHYIIIDYLARWVAGEPRAGSDAAAVRWLHREDWAALPLTEGLGPVLLRALALAGETR